MDFNEKLDNYAHLLVAYGMNVQPGQIVNITGELAQRELIEKLVREAYRRGAKYVHVDFIDLKLTKGRIQESLSDAYLQHVPRFIQIKHDDLVDERAAILRLVGSEDPDLLADLPAKKVNDLQNFYRQSLRRYYAEGVGKCKIQWVVAAGATHAWAKKVYPELDEKLAYETLWDSIFHMCRADKPNCLALWEEHKNRLKQRENLLTSLRIKEIHFTGPGTDLKVFLSPKALFKSCNCTTPTGIDFTANIPTEECLTTPDYRLTEGKVRVTRPVSVNGKLVKDLQMEFRNGVITDFTASQGADHFGSYISSDPGARRLGEVALVGIDSPIYQSKRVFEEILFDENACCHIAVGFAYRFCIEGGNAMTSEELEAVGCNDSSVHCDFMISSEEVDVVATSYSGEQTLLIKKGEWVIPN